MKNEKTTPIKSAAGTLSRMLGNEDTASHLWGDKRYYSLNYYLKTTYGEKVYRLSLDGGMTCPNRDGTLSSNGCAFCSAGGSGDFAASRQLTISEQLSDARFRIQAKTNCHKFIAYFQAYTNTYAPIDHLRRIYMEAIADPEVVVLSIGTRSDCLGEEVLSLLDELNNIKPVWIELGLQSMHNKTLQSMNTHTTLAQFESAAASLHKHGIPVIAHLILGFPGESREDMMASIHFLAHSRIGGIKLQLLHVLKHTALAAQYKIAPFPIFELEEYCDFVIDCLELLPPEMVIHRITGDGPRALLIAPLWSTDKKRILNTIHKRMEERDTWQGKFFLP